MRAQIIFSDASGITQIKKTQRNLKCSRAYSYCTVAFVSLCAYSIIWCSKDPLYEIKITHFGNRKELCKQTA